MLIHGQPADCLGALLQGVTSRAAGADGFRWTLVPPHLDRGSLWRSTTFAYGRSDLLPNWPILKNILRLLNIARLSI